MNNRAATLIGSIANIGRDINKVFSAQCREESTATKSPLPCPNTVKQQKKGFFLVISTLHPIELTEDLNVAYTYVLSLI